MLICGIVAAPLLVACLVWLAPGARAAELQHAFLREFSPPGGVRNLAVDDSGDVYVIGSKLEKFDSSGNPVDFEALGSNAIETEGAVVAVDNSGGVADGDIYVANLSNTIEIYGADGTKLGEITRGASRTFNNLQGMSVDPAGRLYASDLNAPGGKPAIFRYVPSRNPVENADYEAKIQEEIEKFSSYQLAVDSEGAVYGLNSEGEGGEVAKFSPERFGRGVDKPRAPLSGPARGLAVDPSTDALYAALESEIEVLEPNGGSIGSFGAGHLSGPSGIAVDKEGRVFVADSESGTISVFGPEPDLPAVNLGLPSQVGSTAATLNATVNPSGVPVTGCRFEYGGTSLYGLGAPCDPDPGSGSSAVAVSASISGLSSETTYYYRLLVTNSNGTRESSEGTFETVGLPPSLDCGIPRPSLSSNLPDCRAYEQVSPVDKGHIDVANPPESYASDVISPSGNEVAISSYVALPGAASGSLLSGIGASRGSSGWSSFKIDSPFSTSITGPYHATGGSVEFGSSADLTKLFVYSPEALAAGGIQGNANYYYYNSTTGEYRFISTVPDNIFTYPSLSTVFAGGASDGSSFVFRAFLVLESNPPVPPALEAQALSEGILYEWSTSKGLTLVGVLPDGSVDTNGAVPAGSTPFSPEFTIAVQQHVVSGDGRRIYWSEPAGALYLREGTTSKPVSRDPSGTMQPAVFTYATPDGASAFLTSAGRLTNDSSLEGNDLYRYDAASGTLEDLTPGTGHAGSAEVVRVFGASDDGSYIYFQAEGSLAEGATAGTPNVYVWHGGEIRFIGAVDDFLVSAPAEVAASEIGRLWRVSPDGRSFGFVTKVPIAGPHPQRRRPTPQAYLYSYAGNSLTCASCHLGYSNGRVKFVARNSSYVQGGVLPFQSQSAFAVTDGDHLFFSSPDDLIPADTNGKRDVYEYENGRLHLISTGKGIADSELIGATPSGGDVFFTTSDQLVGQDDDNNVDVYDARVEGGIPAQNPAPAAGPCSGEDCRSETASQPGQIEPGSASLVGPGNPAKHRKVTRCKRGKSKKATCAKKHRHRRASHGRKSPHAKKPRHSNARRSAR